MIYVRGFPEINGENFPLDIWSLYMQELTEELPVQQLDTPSPYLGLQIKTDGRSYNGKESARVAQERANFRKPLPSKEPQKPPINAPPPPIYGPPTQQPAPVPVNGQPRQPVGGRPQQPVYGLPQQPVYGQQPAVPVPQ